MWGRDRAMIKILERDELRSVRHRSNGPEDQTFWREFDMEVAAYQERHHAQREGRAAIR